MRRRIVPAPSPATLGGRETLVAALREVADEWADAHDVLDELGAVAEYEDGTPMPLRWRIWVHAGGEPSDREKGA